jgi:hypothetical protein
MFNKNYYCFLIKLFVTSLKQFYLFFHIKSSMNINAAQIQNNLEFGIWHLNLGLGT